MATDCEKGGNLGNPISVNKLLAQVPNTPIARLEAHLERRGFKYFIVGRSKAPVEVETQCDMLLRGYLKFEIGEKILAFET